MSSFVAVAIVFVVTLVPILPVMPAQALTVFGNSDPATYAASARSSTSISAPGQGDTPPAQAKKAEPSAAFRYEERQIEVLEGIRDKLNTSVKVPQSFIPGSTGITTPRLFDIDNDGWEDLFAF
jgi:hypothetical protein